MTLVCLALGVLVAVVHTKSLSKYPPGYYPTIGEYFVRNFRDSESFLWGR